MNSAYTLYTCACVDTGQRLIQANIPCTLESHFEFNLPLRMELCVCTAWAHIPVMGNQESS